MLLSVILTISKEARKSNLNVKGYTGKHTITAMTIDLNLTLRERLLEEAGEELLFLEPSSMDAAIVGLGERCGEEPVLVYDREKLITAFIDDGMDPDSANEWVCTNIEGASMGPLTPIILSTRSIYPTGA